MLLGQGQPQLGPALWQGFAACLPAVLILALMCVTRDGVSLSACCVFPAVCPCVDSHARVRCSPTLALPFPILLSFSYHGCFLPALGKITSPLPAVGHDLRCTTGSTLAAFPPAMQLPLLIPLPASPKRFQEAPGYET